MYKTYKTEISLTESQVNTVNTYTYVCKWLYNKYIEHNYILYNEYKEGNRSKKGSFISANAFDKYINNEVKTKEEFSWINDCAAVARKAAIRNAEAAYKRFFMGITNTPINKTKEREDTKLHFTKNNNGDWTIERHRIQIPTIGKVLLKEKAYLPVGAKVTSGTVSKENGRYYVSVLVEEPTIENKLDKTEGIGIDLGVKYLAICSNGYKAQNINKTPTVKKLKDKLAIEYEILARKQENTNAMKNQTEKIKKLSNKLENIRKEHMNQTINDIIKFNPEYITIEDLNISSIIKNADDLAEAVIEQELYIFRDKLTYKCKCNNIELRVVAKDYASSRICNKCKTIKTDLNLSDRVYKCSCGYNADRDYNASLNLKDATTYTLAY